MKNNKVTMTGVISGLCVYDHMLYGEEFYKTEITVTRKSGTLDVLPVIISERLFDDPEDLLGRMVNVTGEYRSHNQTDNEKRKLLLYVFAHELEFTEEEDTRDNNLIFLDGYICKSPVYRTTPRGTEIADLLVAVNRQYTRSDYIPCIVFGRNARWAEQLEVGTHVKLQGRVQSRVYKKQICENVCEYRTAYEVAVHGIMKVNE